MVDYEFWLDGEAASSFGIVLQKPVEFSEAKPYTESVRVLGKNGAHVYEDGSYMNVRGSASCYALRDNVGDLLGNISAWLRVRTGYRRLETSEEVGTFRLARVSRAQRYEVRAGLLAPFEIEFDCKPQRFFHYGEHFITYSAAGQIINPTGFSAKPLIEVIGSGPGTITVGETTVTLTECDGVLIDCEEQEVTRNGESANNLLSGDWPLLGAGANTVAFTGGVTAVKITPRWWTL